MLVFLTPLRDCLWSFFFFFQKYRFRQPMYHSIYSFTFSWVKKLSKTKIVSSTLLFLGHRSLIKNKTQTAEINIVSFVCYSTCIFKSDQRKWRDYKIIYYKKMSTSAVKSCCLLYSLLNLISRPLVIFEYSLVIFVNDHLRSLLKMYVE